jgi:membrane protease YdiL (CAAX protease family)
MNPIIILIASIALVAGWFGFDRMYNPTRKANLELAPVVREAHTERLLTVRALAFFLILDFIITAIGILIAAAVIAVVAPPANKTLGEAYGLVLGSSAGANEGLLNPIALPGALVNFIGMLGAVYVSQRFVRGKNFTDLGLRFYKIAPLDILAGLLCGPIAFALIFMLERNVGYIAGTHGPTFDWVALLGYALTFLLIAVGEEIVVRGYILQTLNGGWDGGVAIVASSLFWGVTHLLNPYSNPIAALDITVVGVVFAYAYLITGHLWLPIALHFAWNFAEGAIFGFPVSGYTLPNGIFQPYIEGPNAVTGGDFGPEGGIIMVVALVVLGGLLYGWSKVRQPPTPTPTTQK